MGRMLVEEGHPHSDSFQHDIDDLLEKWDEITLAGEERKHRLELSSTAQQVGLFITVTLMMLIFFVYFVD